MLNVALVGLGGWGRQVVRSIHGPSDKIRVVRAIDVNPDAAADFAAELKIPLSSDYQAALDDPAVDAVILTTPHTLHEEQVMRAVAANKPIFCEKPLALSRDSAARIVAACRDASLVLGVGHERRYEPAMEAIADVVDSGALGTILHAEVNCSHDRAVGRPGNHWRHDAVESPAAAMTGTGVHLTDLLVSMLGPFATVFASAAAHVVPMATGDHISVQIAFASGVSGLLGASLTTPFYARFALFGDRGWVETQEDAYVHEGSESRFTLYTKDAGRETRTYESRDTVRANLDAWADAIAGRGAYRFSDEQRIHNVAILEAISRSMNSGAVERVAPS